MKRRRLSRPDQDRILAREVQLCRLAGIARGELEPKCEREAFFQWFLQQDGRARLTDFILPLPLLLLEVEVEAITAAPLEAENGSPNFTPSPEPAISPG